MTMSNIISLTLGNYLTTQCIDKHDDCSTLVGIFLRST